MTDPSEPDLPDEGIPDDAAPHDADQQAAGHPGAAHRGPGQPDRDAASPDERAAAQTDEGGAGSHDGGVEWDLVERGRAIFERLRSDHDQPEAVAAPEALGEDPADATGGADGPLEGGEPASVRADHGSGGSAPEQEGAGPASEAADRGPGGPVPHAPDPSAAHQPPEDSAGVDVADPRPEAPEVPARDSADGPPTPPPGPDAPVLADGAPRGPAPGDASGSSPFEAPLPRVVAIANQKGGVGKTTTAVNLGACLAELGYRVLVIDLDPQGNATTGLGVNPRNLQVSMYDVLLNDRGIDDCIEPTAVRGLFVAPSSLDLAGAEIELVPVFSRELKLKRALDEVVDDYDFVLIDCPPSLGLLTVNGLAAASEVLVPIQCEYYALEGLGQLLRNVNLVQQNLNPTLELRAIVLVMYDARTRLSGEVVAEVRTHFGDKVCRNVIPRTVRLSEAPSFGQPIVSFDASSRGAIAYRELAREFSGGAPTLAGTSRSTV